MKATELRIGNLLDLYGTTATLQGFDFYCHFSNDDRKLSRFKPIPLTEEWLLKFGFEKRGSYWHPKGSWHRYLFHKFKMSSFGVLNLEPEGGIVPHAQVHYVHQLQNLYFALTGEELILKR
jgi:hypothetical protein